MSDDGIMGAELLAIRPDGPHGSSRRPCALTELASAGLHATTVEALQTEAGRILAAALEAEAVTVQPAAEGPGPALLQVSGGRSGSLAETLLPAAAAVLGLAFDRVRQRHAQQELLAEMQHRIRNNIGIVAGLVRMRMRKLEDAGARQELKLVGDRIEALRLAHEQVHTARGQERLPLRDYVTGLLHRLVELHRDGGSGAVRLDIRVAPLDLQADKAVPLGLILNECVTNSLKHAFPGGDGTVTVDAQPAAGGLVRIAIRDDGPGMACPPDVSSRAPGTGMRLIQGLARQLGAEPQWSGEGGTQLLLEFPV